MIDKKILVIANYPVVQPRDGGQKRVAAIISEYKKVFRQVRFVAVFKGHYARYRRNDIYVRANGGWPNHLIPFIGDLVAGEAIFSDPRIRKKITKLLLSYRPDIIQIEQSFPYIGLKPLLESLDLHPKIILSSHNIEHRMKAEILKGLGVSVSQAKPIIDIIHKTEESLSRDADLTIAVSEQDMLAHQKMGSKKCIIAPNGIAKMSPSSVAVDYWKRYLNSRGIEHVVTFVGSAHPPNWVGFLTTVGDRMGFLAPNTRLLLAGSVADYFDQNLRDGSPAHLTFWRRVIPVGRLSEDRLAGLISVSDVLILPITEGGGSNLKTAEAILSGLKVVATKYAFRSFEAYMSLPNIYIADSPEAFRQAIVSAINTPLKKRTESQQNLAEKVQWHFSLHNAVEEVKKL